MKDKFRKFDYHYWIIVLLAIVFLVLTTRMGSFFGSSIDWYNQHIRFPEYFRTLFYETGDFFPNFAFNIGSGQNIYNFSYYGLYNPLLLFSYLLPFVKMIDYIQVLNIFLYISIGVLSYKFLKKEVSNKVAFIGSIFFLLAVPILFHIHRHYMFVSYFPFLLICLLCIRKYFDDGCVSLFIIFNTLLILTSYYYSIASILVEVVYFTYIFLKRNKFNFKSYLLKGIPLALGVVLAISLSAVLILPTMIAVKNGRGVTNNLLKWYEIILPNFNIKNFLYDNYGLGLSFISVVSIVYYLLKKRVDNNKRFLSIILSIVIFLPAVMYLLNGRLYIRSKVLIPFIPLVILILSNFLEGIMLKLVDFKKEIISVFVIFLIFNIFYKSDFLVLLIIDFILTYLFLFTNYKKRSLVALFGFLIVNNMIFSYGESFINKHYSSEKDSTKYIRNVLYRDKNIYRMKQIDFSLRNVNRVYSSKYYSPSVYSSLENKYYSDFLKNDLSIAFPNRNKLMYTVTNNIIYDSYFGVKYVVGRGNMFGYEKYDKNIFYNSNNRGIIYTTNKIVNLKDYKKRKYPYNLEYLFNGVLLDRKSNIKISSNIKRVPVSVNVLDKNIVRDKDRTTIKSDKNLSFSIKKSENLKNKLLFISFKINNKSSCDKDDRYISINGIMNKLSCASLDYEYQNDNYTFHYVLADNDDYLIKIGMGDYDISNLEVYSMDYDDFKALSENINYMDFDYQETKGDIIKGNIKVIDDGYLVTTIPYDEGFSIYIDGEKQELMRVNKAFIGSSITKGKHDIKIVYQAPLLKEGKVVSFISLILLIIVMIYEKFVRCKVVLKSKKSVSQGEEVVID